VLVTLALTALASGCRPAVPADPPVANPDMATTDEDMPVTINVLANDTPADTGDILSVTGCTDGDHGTVTRSGDELTYTPAPDYNGLDIFTYTISDGNGGTAEGKVTVTVTPVDEIYPDYPEVVIDWASFFAPLPEPGWKLAFDAHHVAVEEALRRAYAVNPFVRLDDFPIYDPAVNNYGYVWELHKYSLEDHGLHDNPTLAAAEVGFVLSPDEEAPPDDVDITGMLDARWSQTSEVVLKQMNRALSDMSRCMVEGYLPVGESFWVGYDSLIRLATRELLPEGTYYLPGSDGREIRVRISRVRYLEGFHSVDFSLKLSPEDRSGGSLTDWGDLAAGVSKPESSDDLWDYERRVRDALAAYWGPRDRHVSVNSGEATSPSEDWDETQLFWLRVPGSSDEACVLEKLALCFSPIDAVAAEDARADHGSLTVTEELAWEPRSYEGAPPTWQALAGARDVMIGAYLPVDDTFADQLATTKLSEDSAADLVGQDGRKIRFEVEELTQEAGLWRCLYTLTWGQ